ncbi:MAG: hypothetical protein EYC70_17110 [Planctomycetota bacterium]|nr:MAG: hypothetical protein EYC70_17110 [Planctomycetota bacterium]
MARVFYVHWHEDEALDAVRAMRAAGHTVVYHWDSQTGADTWKTFKASPPDVLVVSLARLPSHGRRVAAVTTETKKYRHIPVFFVDGAPEKLAVARKQFPQATFTTSGRLLDALSLLG